MDILRELFQNPFVAWGTEASNTALLFTIGSFILGLWTAYLIWGRLAGRRRRAYETLEGKHNKLNAEYLGISEKYDLREADIKKTNIEIEELNEQLGEENAQRERLHAQLFSTKDNNVKLKTDNETYLQKIDMLDNQIISLQTQNIQLNEEVEENAATVENLNTIQSSYETTKDRLSAMDDKMTHLAETNEKLKQENNAYIQKVDSLGDELNALREKNNQINENIGQNTSAMNNLANLQTNYDSTSSRISVLEERLAKLANDNQSLKVELNSIKTNKSFTPPVVPVPPVAKKEEPEEDEVARVEKIIKTPTKSATEAKSALRNAMGTKIKKASAADKDDLKKINGIGPFIENKLNALDIYTYEQISQLDKELVDTVTDAIEFFPGRIERDDWVGQAKKLMGTTTTTTSSNERLSFGSLSTSPRTTPVKDEKGKDVDTSDLKIVEGIGPAIEKLLHNNGIKDWATLAGSNEATLKGILDSAGGRYRLANPGTWPQQAHLANTNQWTKLKEYQDFLDGGKDPGNK